MMMDTGKCLYCYEKLKESETEFHPKCSMKFFGSRTNYIFDVKNEDIEKLASESINRSLSVPGVQKKLSLELKKTKKNTRLTIVGFKGNYILKPPSAEYRELPENEDLTMHLAEISGIETAGHSLIKLASGELAYITKRFDRINGDKLQSEDMNQLTGNLTSDKYSGSVEKIGKLIDKYCTFSLLDKIKLFRLIIFSFLTGNADMHLKNYSLIKKPDGHITLSPAYDMLSTKMVIPEDKEESALTINGKKRNLKSGDMNVLAERLGIINKVRDEILNDFRKTIPLMIEFTGKSFLSEELKSEYRNLISEKAGILKIA